MGRNQRHPCRNRLVKVAHLAAPVCCSDFARRLSSSSRSRPRSAPRPRSVDDHVGAPLAANGRHFLGTEPGFPASSQPHCCSKRFSVFTPAIVVVPVNEQIQLLGGGGTGRSTAEIYDRQRLSSCGPCGVAGLRKQAGRQGHPGLSAGRPRRFSADQWPRWRWGGRISKASIHQHQGETAGWWRSPSGRRSPQS